jgi:hypothetical protein
VVSQKISKMQEEMVKKQDEIREEYEEKIRIEKETREREEEEKIRKQNIHQKFINGTVAVATKIKEQNRQIDEYVRLFSTNHGRKPLKDEINESLNVKMDNDILNKYLDRYNSDFVDFEIDENDDKV